jgi:hypothetical protein
MLKKIVFVATLVVASFVSFKAGTHAPTVGAQVQAVPSTCKELGLCAY